MSPTHKEGRRNVLPTLTEKARVVKKKGVGWGLGCCHELRLALVTPLDLVSTCPTVAAVVDMDIAQVSIGFCLDII